MYFIPHARVARRAGAERRRPTPRAATETRRSARVRVTPSGVPATEDYRQLCALYE